MVQKPKIQYVGQFYIHGSEALAMDPAQPSKKPKTRLPLARLEKIEKVYVDPVALIAMAVAVFMLITMVLGVLQLRDDWAEYEQVSAYLHRLKDTNHKDTVKFRSSYDLDDIRVKALAMGMVPKADAEDMTVKVTPPEKDPEPTWIDDLKWFLGGLFA